MASQKMIKKIVNATYEEFVKIMSKAKNAADFFIEIDDVFKATIEENARQKKEIETETRHIKEAQADLRANMIRFFQNNGLDRIDGVKSKSITFTPAKTEKGTESWREIKISGKYVPLDLVGKYELVEMLEKLGVKTREQSRSATREKEAAIRLNR